MQVEFRTEGFDAGRELQHLARCCAGYELGPFRQRIERVRVHLSAAPERSRGREIGCAVRIDTFGRGSVTAAAADSNPYVAIHWALERAGEAVSRQLQAERRDERVAGGLVAAGNLAAGVEVADRAA